ncbi:NACHT domain-containing protein [Dactylosporangium sucinum]|uniref:NACHT domain-containing protein n=1 Tax=Dactylosporangium sucinum TaxID=1424081 RepID=UPI00167EDC5E|nr:NACHT domain-containing protein [Dactylosporangium sucinum]
MERELAGLASSVTAVWKPEQARRRLLNPRPLPTAWTTIGPPIADHWANVRADGRDEPLDLAGVVDLAHPDAFHRTVTDPLLRGRIVLLGDPGAGKTALLLRLTLTLLAEREQAAARDARSGPLPVPVLLRLSTWNPDEQTLERWITTRLDADYGHRRPVPIRHLMPLLDGLDEMPEPRRRQALQAISNTFVDTPIVLTSRTAEYLDALAALAGNTLAAAAVLELTALLAATVRDYLQLTTARPVSWADVFTRDAADCGGRLAAALSAPLWVDLARTTYTDPDRADNDPTELLHLPDIDSIHSRLLDRLIPTAYPDPPEPAPDGNTWRRDDAHRWLQHLAIDMHHRDTQDLAWWQLTLAVPRPLKFAIGLGIGLGIGFWWVGMMFGVVFGIMFGGALAPHPARRRIRWRRTSRFFSRQLAAVLALAVTIALGTGLAFGFTVALVYGLPLGLVFGFGAEFTTLLRVNDADVPAATDPVGLLRGDRRRVITAGLVATLPAGLLILVIGLRGGLVAALVAALAGGLAGGLAVALGVGVTLGAWLRFEVARLWWCGKGRLPWRLMAFLADAHRRGVLRQAGGVWQFRHALLRDRLVATVEEQARR